MFLSFAWNTWYNRHVNCVNVIFLQHEWSVTNKLFSRWVLAFVTFPLYCCQGAISLRPMPSPAFGEWAPRFLLPTPPWASWMETQLHLIHFWFSFFFFSCPSVLLLCFPSLLCCVLISPTPLLCHQLALLVSKSWSHCACVALFLFSITHICMDCCGIPQTRSSN